MTIPLVSIVLPTFNRLEYLRAAVESARAQTLRDWELIIADDGSGSETMDYLRGLHRPPCIELICLPHTGNPSAVRNVAIRRARGKYVAFLDSDDVWMPEKLALQVEALRNNAASRWVYTGWSAIDADGTPKRLGAPKPWVPYRGWITEQLLELEALIATAAVLVERDLLAEVGGFDENLAMFEHYDLWLRLAARSEVEVIDAPLTCLRSHDQHYGMAALPMAAGRHSMLEKMRGRALDAHTRALVDRLYARSALRLAKVQANTSRTVAIRTLLCSCTHGVRHAEWWSGAPGVLLKTALPRAFVALYGRHRRRWPARTGYDTR